MSKGSIFTTSSVGWSAGSAFGESAPNVTRSTSWLPNSMRPAKPRVFSFGFFACSSSSGPPGSERSGMPKRPRFGALVVVVVRADRLSSSMRSDRILS